MQLVWVEAKIEPEIKNDFNLVEAVWKALNQVCCAIYPSEVNENVNGERKGFVII